MQIVLLRQPVDASVDALEDLPPLVAVEEVLHEEGDFRFGITPDPTGRHQCESAKRVRCCAFELSASRRVASDA
jgi:hypothetical protein